MQINSVTGSSFQAIQGGNPFAKTKQAFDDLGSALESGNLSDAKAALEQLQKNAPPQAANKNNPLSAKMEALSKAVDSGDLEAAQDAYADIKKTAPQRPAGGGRAGAPGGPPPGGANNTSSAGGSSNSNKVYDPKDANKDGTVSWKEEQDYNLKHPEAASQASAAIGSERGVLDALA